MVKYWKSFDDSRESYINAFQTSVKSIFEKERKALKTGLSKVSSVSEMDSRQRKIIDKNKPEWIKSMTAAYLVVIREFGIRVYNEINSLKNIGFDPYATEVMKFISSTVASKVVMVSDTTKNHIKMRIDEGITSGLSIEQIAKLIDQLYLDEIIPNRSRTIAQTEVMAASNYGSWAAARQSGADLLKYWIPTMDQRTRDTHLAMGNHKAVGLDDLFSVGGSKMKYPGDPAGGAAECINCRCAIGYKRKK